jgi:DNA-binding response OmpR family regulator
VTEDDDAIRRLLAMTLRRRRLDVELATDGSEALAALQRERFEVLVLDLMLPRVSGWAVVQWLAANPRQRPRSVIVVSAADRDLLRRLDPTVVNAILFKPFDIDQLGAYVRNAAYREERDQRRARLVKTT